MEIFEYSLLSEELKAQTDYAKKQYQNLDYTDKFNKIIKKEKYKSNLIYDTNHSFYRHYRDTKNFNKISFKSMGYLLNDKLDNLNPQKENTCEKKMNMYDKASELYNDFPQIYYYKCYKLSDEKRKNIESKYNPKYLSFDGYDYSMWLENEEESENIPPMPSPEGEEEVKLELEETTAKSKIKTSRKKKNRNRNANNLSIRLPK